jgi:serine phosphatase RsbU (regulator of sigma subunit)
LGEQPSTTGNRSLGSIFRKIFRNATTRVLILVFAVIIGITAFFLVSGYFTQIALYEKSELNKLSGIANTLAGQIDGTAHDIMYRHYPKKDELTTIDQDHTYLAFHQILHETYIANKLDSPIYTMVYEPEEDLFYFAVFSNTDKIYWRHEWREFKKEHVDNYQSGGVIRPYTDENGTWLSAFAPIRDHKGVVTAAVQVDSKFDVFIKQALYEIMIRTLISLAIISLIGYFLFRSISSILRKEEQLTNEILQSHSIIEQKNKDITDSIQYAKRIQEAILPSVPAIHKQLPDSFVLFLPRDIVSGDFYWFTENTDHIYIAAIDCTGHGVPGAFMSMIGNTLLNEIINQKKIHDPGRILDQLDEGIGIALKQKEGVQTQRDGMDVALVSFHKNFKELEYSGAFRPLLHLRGEDLVEVKGNRFPIGGGSAYEKIPFTTHKVELQPGDIILIFSDGYPDQIGGEGGKKFMTKRFKDMILANRNLPMSEMEKMFRQTLNDWQGEHEQMDDILVIGIRVPR